MAFISCRKDYNEPFRDKNYGCPWKTIEIHIQTEYQTLRYDTWMLIEHWGSGMQYYDGIYEPNAVLNGECIMDRRFVCSWKVDGKLQWLGWGRIGVHADIIAYMRDGKVVTNLDTTFIQINNP